MTLAARKRRGGPIARATRRAFAVWGVTMLLAACVLPMPDENRSPSSYERSGSGYTDSYAGGRHEYRGTLPSGTYTESCRDMYVDHDRHRLEAECRRRDGRWRLTYLDLRECDRGIVNEDGWLACRRQEAMRLPAGSYRETCRDFSIDNGRLEARCRRRNGDWRDTALNFKACKGPIRNDDGRLVCG